MDLEDLELRFRCIVGGTATAMVGFGLLLTGDLPAKAAGAGALVAAALVFALLRRLRNFEKVAAAPVKTTEADQENCQSLDGLSRRSVFWLGIAFILAPGLLCLHLCYAMARVDPLALLFIGGPLWFGGIGCVVVALRPPGKSRSDV